MHEQPVNAHVRSSQIALLLCLSLILIIGLTSVLLSAQPGEQTLSPLPAKRVEGVCPPFHLLDETGAIIDPVNGLNADKPYSPAKTCGKCHDYEKITQGFHFQQGKGEAPTADQEARCAWASTPGNYGGTWCSPAPLYRYLSDKQNDSPARMDMTSFTFITAGCGSCHPGGGPMEFDREGIRYDHWMADPASGLQTAADNNFDGDYYQARWSETGVVEADCLICHLPQYKMSVRNKELAKLNFRWLASAGGGFARISGSVSEGTPVSVAYDMTAFNADGTFALHLVREPRNEACLACHEKPGWKKRGANFSPRTDVHLRAGLKCVDCHPAASSAEDERIRGKEVHQFAKGDDPGGHVRDDLDNTVRDCDSCHGTGKMGAPIAHHRWLPPLHLEKIACQTCHIPERNVKAAHLVASDVFNPGARIPDKGKHLWTFYGPDMRYWNHYGDLELMGYDDKPTDPYRPELARYKGKIYPVNRLHSSWPALRIGGSTALMQPKMGAIYQMWSEHRKNPESWPRLAEIGDDDGDGVIEINRPQEIEALIASIDALLRATGYPMENTQVVWVLNDRVYSSATTFETIPLRDWEAAAFGNVHKYNHDVYPARAALGSTGCIECHHPDSPVFFAAVANTPFGTDGQPETRPQFEVMGVDNLSATVGAWRETYGKPILYGLLIVLFCSLIIFIGMSISARNGGAISSLIARSPWIVGGGLGLMALLILSRPDLSEYMLPSRFWLDSNHFLVALLVIITGLVGLFLNANEQASKHLLAPRYLVILGGLITAVVSGTFMFFNPPGLEMITRASYTLFDLSLIVILLGCVFALLRKSLTLTTKESHS